MDNLFSQDYNPFTGDIWFNPASFGLSLRDIDEAASIKLRAAMTSWGIALTADQYREIQSIAETKYQWLDASSGLFNWSVLPAVNMTWRNPGLYMTQQYMGFWTWTEWVSYIGNNGNFEFKWNLNNYIRWNGTALDIRWVLQLTNWTSIEDYVAANSTKPMVNSQYNSWLEKYQQWINTWDLLPYTIGAWATWVYMTSAWLFWVKNGVNQFSISSSTGDAMFRWTVYASWWEFSWNITASWTITWGTIVWASILTWNSWRRVEISGNNFRGYDSSWVLRVQTADSGMRFSDYTWVYNSDISSWVFELSWGSIIWPYIVVSDTSVPTNRVWIRTAFITWTTNSISIDMYLGWWQISFRWVNNAIWSWVILTSPNDDTLIVSWNTITLAGKNLYSNGTDLYWNGVKIN